MKVLLIDDDENFISSLVLEFQDRKIEVTAYTQYADIPIVMITFCAGDEQKRHAEALGIKNFMGKPYQELELLETINALLGKK